MCSHEFLDKAQSLVYEAKAAYAQSMAVIKGVQAALHYGKET